jgi:hypothetical protein
MDRRDVSLAMRHLGGAAIAVAGLVMVIVSTTLPSPAANAAETAPRITLIGDHRLPT